MDVFGSRIEEVKLFKNHSNMLLNEQTDSGKKLDVVFNGVQISMCLVFLFGEFSIYLCLINIFQSLCQGCCRLISFQVLSAPGLDTSV